MNQKINIAYGSVPKDGGTYTFYRNIRPAIKKFGINIFSVSIGREQKSLWEESYADSNSILLAEDTYNVKKQAKIFVKWCETNNIDIVIGINSEAILSAIPHLPKNIKVVSRCANSFDHGYKITLSGRERLEAIFAITPKIQDDLINKYNAKKNQIYLIPNGVNPLPFEKASKKIRGNNKILHLGFLGRIEHNQKGVMHLPKLVQFLIDIKIPFHLKIAGKGADRIKLEKSMRPYINQGYVSFLGALTRNEVPVFFENTDIYIFPSHFEGCPNSLLEAMVSGCVPFAWQISGLTDFIIKDKESGFLHTLGDCQSMANNISLLHKNRLLLQNLSKNAINETLLRFSPEKTASAYADVFHEVKNNPPLDIEPLSWNKFKPDENFKQKGDPWLPRGLKKLIKKILYQTPSA